MSEQKIPCSTCGTEILAQTAERTGGQCMPCAGQRAPGGKKTTSPKGSKGDDTLAWLAVIGIAAVILIIPVLISVGVGFSSLLFGASPLTAFWIGLGTYCAIKFIGVIISGLESISEIIINVSQWRKKRASQRPEGPKDKDRYLR